MQQNRYYVLRLNHRIKRDKRLTTHVGLISRAFGCSAFFYSGEEDPKMENSIMEVNESWGDSGNFSVEFWDDWLRVLKLLSKNDQVIFVHLTMYGSLIQEVQGKIKNLYENDGKIVFLIVGGAKIPDILYKISHFNVAVTNQPHSEAGALAVALDRFFEHSITTNFSKED